MTVMQLPITKHFAKSTLFSQMYSFRHNVTISDFAENRITPSEKTQYTYIRHSLGHTHKSPTLVRGFEVFDTWIDYCQAIDNGKYHKVIGTYYRLKRLLNQ